jgi:hypothetical protein
MTRLCDRSKKTIETGHGPIRLKIAQHGLLVAVVACVAPDDRSRAANPALASCDRAAARTVVQHLEAGGARIALEDGWVVVRFGADYTVWTPQQTEALIAVYADADACLHQRARKIEYQSPIGAVIARADPVRGIRMTGR